MMLLRTAAVVALISGSATLLAGEFWQDKQPSDWTDKDIQRLVTKSPWAKEASLSSNPDRMAGMGRRGGMGGRGSMGGPGMGRPGMGEGGMRGPRGEERSRGSRSAPQLTVRWDSAAPLRQAAAKGQPDAQAKKVAEWAPEFYVVTLTGMPMRLGRGRGEEPPESDSGRVARIEDRLKEVTLLKLKGSSGSIAPARVEVTDAPGGRVIALLFPRSETISLDDKEVDLETAMGPREVKVKFTLKDMVYRGKLEL
jgi:hypothetical protein